MKKLILFLALIINVNIFAGYYLDLALRPGVNVNSTLDKSGVKNNDLNFSLGGELGGNLGYVTVGGGIQFNNAMSFEGDTAGTTGDLKLMPYYAYARFNIFPIVFKPYLVYKVGINKVVNYTGFGTGVEDGTYWAVGFFFFFYNLLGEISYQNSTMTINGVDENLSQIQLVLGIKAF
mgnify:CR=1 FL=1